MNTLNPTHSPDLRSWISSANRAGHDFPIQNLPFGVFSRRGGDTSPRIGVAIGDEILDLRACQDAGLLDSLDRDIAEALTRGSLNRFAVLGREASALARERISSLLAFDNPELRDDPAKRKLTLVAGHSVNMHLPLEIGDYTDFYSSAYHAFNIGSMFRPDQPLLPNYKYLPVGYHGRASSIVASGKPVRRPSGQTIGKEVDPPRFGECKQLDYELEVGFFVGSGNQLGERVPIDSAELHLFGICLVNDWSARDIQRWEYQPLGPFLAKSFATTISPWVVTMEALAPFRAPALTRPAGDPAPLPHLLSRADQEAGGIGLTLEVTIESQQMRERGIDPQVVSRGDFRDMYWTPAQMLTHHTSNGCNLRPGDLLASGTVSGPTKDSRGCLLELAWRGTDPITLPTGETRRFLEDGDQVVLRGYCERENAVRIGLGECRGRILGCALP
ncbi:MAG: fumarylacetoacetase [Acidobacteriota bacterium]